MNVGRKEYSQCQCGRIQQAELKKCKVIDDIYVELYCPRCRQTMRHLLCGDKEEDIYIYYDVTKDLRFYNYTTK